MIDFATDDTAATPLYAVTAEDWPRFAQDLAESDRRLAELQGFGGKSGQVALLSDHDGALVSVLAGLGDAEQRRRGRFLLASAAGKLPEGVYRLLGIDDPSAREEAALGWLLESYRFTRYKTCAPMKARLLAPEGVDAAKITAQAEAERLGRDLINTTAADLGPMALAEAAHALAERFGGHCRVISGEALLTENLPMIHAVGRAADRAPCLIDLHWGDAGPALTLVGKGVVFDTGGLNLKPGGSMGLMKKDMGGAAAMIAAAQMIMASGTKCRLRLLIPAVENAIGAGAFRPGDVLTSRKGLSVEVNNTDAEGRLVLADALTLAGEEAPDLIVSAATLTGAARVALGPDIPPFFATQANDAAILAQQSLAVGDPLWPMPFWPAYEGLIEPAIADLDNAPSGGMAGAITAALFLKRFVPEGARYIHMDIYGWQPKAEPARPKGGAVQGARALVAALPEVLAW